MANYDMKQLQQCILRNLLAFDKICKEHNLHYYLLFGTMLGAVRHKGFIPWDDDIDVGLPRPEYEEFRRNAKFWLPAPYEFICYENDHNYMGGFGKMQDSSTTLIERQHIGYIGGVYMDIFPIDGIPSNNIAQRIQYYRYQYYKQILYFLNRDPYKHGHGVSSWLPLIIHKTFTKDKMQKRLHKLMTKYDYDKSEYVSQLNDGMTSVMPKTVLGTPTPVEFEGYTVMGVEHPDEYLTREFGDYMQIPKPEDRISHNFHYLDLEMPYREYIRNNKE